MKGTGYWLDVVVVTLGYVQRVEYLSQAVNKQGQDVGFQTIGFSLKLNLTLTQGFRFGSNS